MDRPTPMRRPEREPVTSWMPASAWREHREHAYPPAEPGRPHEAASAPAPTPSTGPALSAAAVFLPAGLPRDGRSPSGTRTRGRCPRGRPGRS